MSTALSQFWDDHPEYRGRAKEPGIFGTNVALAASAPLQQSDIVISDCDFVITSAVGSQTTAVTNAAYILSPLLLNILYTSVQRNITNILLEWSNVITLLNTYTPNQYWPYPLLVKQMNTISVQLSNPIATASSVWISFQGVKVFNRPARQG